MAQGLSGLARGFVQGADLGLRIKRQQQSEREEGELSKLRSAQEDRAQTGETRAQETHEQMSELRQLQEGRAKATEKRLMSGEKRMVSAEKRMVSGAERLEEEFNWKVAKDKRAEKDKALSSMAPIEYQRVAQGGDFSPEFMDQAEGTRFDPTFMAKQEYKDAAKTSFEYVNKMMGKIRKDGVKSVGLKEMNDPEFVNSLNTLMSPDIQQGVGEVDPATGKKVESKRLVSIVPYAEGKGIVMEVQTVFDDGSSYTAPITEGRSSDPKDPVKVIPVDKFMDHIEGYTRMASAFNQPDLRNAVTRYTGKPGSEVSSKEVTRRQYLREVSGVDKWEADQLGKVDPEGYMEPEDKKARISSIKKQAQTLRGSLAKRYDEAPKADIGKGNASVTAPRGGGEAMTNLNTWSADDPRKQAFISEGQKYASEQGASNPFDAFSPDELNKIYTEWINDKDAEDVAASLRP